ncbi:unnamed protein product [Alternaria alternata]
MDERNHQVTQMGAIYSKAELVIVWLGLASEETLLHFANKPQVSPYRKARKTIQEDLSGNQYWTRAWITQELVLAHRINVAIGPLTFTFDKLVDLVRKSGWRKDRATPFYPFLDLGYSKINILGKPIGSLLDTFRD